MKTTTLILLFAAMFCQAGCSQSVQSNNNNNVYRYNLASCGYEGRVKTVTKIEYATVDSVLDNTPIVRFLGNDDISNTKDKQSDSINVFGKAIRGKIYNKKIEKFDTLGNLEYENDNGRISKYNNGLQMELIDTVCIDVFMPYYGEDNIKINKEKEFYTYDLNGHCIKTERYINDTIKETTLGKFDRNNNLIESKIYDNRNAIIFYDVFKYDNKGRNIRFTRYNKENKIELDEKWIYNNDSTETKITKDINGHGDTTIFSYNNKEKLVKKTRISEKNKVNEYTYVYDDKNNIPTQEYTNGKLDSERKFVYNENGKVIEINEKRLIMTDPDEYDTRWTQIKYDSIGNRIEEKEYHKSILGEGSRITSYKYEYYE